MLDTKGNDITSTATAECLGDLLMSILPRYSSTFTERPCYVSTLSFYQYAATIFLEYNQYYLRPG
jgi:hypothetical protein